MYACECKTAMPKPVTLDRERGPLQWIYTLGQKPKV